MKVRISVFQTLETALGYGTPSVSPILYISIIVQHTKRRHPPAATNRNTRDLSVFLIPTGPLSPFGWSACRNLLLMQHLLTPHGVQHHSPLKSHNCYQWKPGLCCGYTQRLSGQFHRVCQNQQDYVDLDGGQNSGKSNKWRALYARFSNVCVLSWSFWRLVRNIPPTHPILWPSPCIISLCTAILHSLRTTWTFAHMLVLGNYKHDFKPKDTCQSRPLNVLQLYIVS